MTGGIIQNHCKINVPQFKSNDQNQNQNIFTGDTSTDIHSPGPKVAKASL